MKSVRQVLVEARGIVAERWCKGNYADGNANYCAAGAINLAAGEMREDHGSLTYADTDLAVKRLAYDCRSALMDALPTPYESIATYNDDPATAQADVLAVFDKAIASC